MEYDSLSDLLAFGLAPALLAYEWALRPYGKWGWSVAFLFVVCGALRLARYNVQIDNVEAVSFNGLPIPAAAGMVVSTVLLFYKFDKPGSTDHPVVLAGIFLLALLMVSNLKFASFKELDLRRRKPFPVLLGIIVLLILIVNEPQIVLFTIGVLYVLHGPVWNFLLWRKRRAGIEPCCRLSVRGTAGQLRRGGDEREGKKPMTTHPIPIRIFDTTLRDGEQSRAQA